MISSSPSRTSLHKEPSYSTATHLGSTLPDAPPSPQKPPASNAVTTPPSNATTNTRPTTAHVTDSNHISDSSRDGCPLIRVPRVFEVDFDKWPCCVSWSGLVGWQDAHWADLTSGMDAQFHACGGNDRISARVGNVRLGKTVSIMAM